MFFLKAGAPPARQRASESQIWYGVVRVQCSEDLAAGPNRAGDTKPADRLAGKRGDLVGGPGLGGPDNRPPVTNNL